MFNIETGVHWREYVCVCLSLCSVLDLRLCKGKGCLHVMHLRGYASSGRAHPHPCQYSARQVVLSS